ncbi:hypothetical protein DPMN_087129 [Dreissena polymorpha]|uniref:Uncharacterized protein n=1 Tax=Dreissena polymorpha TaxID=45954 RepID=A0A9D4QW30_DREPO|nr:hypothetical protein DPMN_087129 [Dreissena polymorpha]
MELRETFFRKECMQTIFGPLSKDSGVCFYFGSQSEGTTTPGLNSDIDWLRSHGDANIMTVWRDWEAGMDNLLMFYDDITPLQQCLLQFIEKYTPEPSGHLNFVRKDLDKYC